MGLCPVGVDHADQWRCGTDQRSAESGLGASSALCEAQAGPRIRSALALAVQTPIALGRAFFRRAALVLDFDAAFFLGLLASGRVGFFAFGTGCARSTQQCKRQAGIKKRSAQATAAQ